MTNYNLAVPESVTEIGRRAMRLRVLLGKTTMQVATEAAVEEREVSALEEGGTISLAATLAIHRVLSTDSGGDTLFTRAKLQSIDEVEAFERRRLAGR